MRRTGDPFTEAFANRENKAFAADTLKKVTGEYSKKSTADKK